MGTIIIILIIGFVVYGLLSNAKTEGSRVVDNATASLTGERGYCINCKHCCRDDELQYSKTGFFCALSRCENIDEETMMDCVVKPTITENDLQELFALKIWTVSGEQYIRNQLLGKKMTFAELDSFLSQLPKTHPEFIRPGAADKYTS